ncbi:MAG TPA: molecular chaperone DnaJ [Acidimicrobiales bacterium]|nr:molecular chaperone DnaJ [Actinomycetota bacterium]MDP6061970.1 molecular chaperone DnaJ [Acidimicrobiales bacterium]MDP6214372.1 molecular chaperone DnaJ [Acidimicrobiales bacterium]MDP7209550.1 molecular chaperone DnaJ [Acidimicrobiales bacterium]HJL89892.1 molecular chaperone DnaJ [Acidimicrobiales bacterium]
MTAQREWFDKDYYRTLGVDKGSSAKDVTKAYRKLARKLHPDANPGDDAAEQRFKEVTAAYDVLGDESKREEYDQVRARGPMPGMGGAPGGGFGGHGGAPFDLGDVFGGLFGQGGRGHRGGTRGVDLETRLGLSFLEAVNGVTTSVHLTSDAACSSCGGSGARPGTRPHRCSACGGSGATADNQGPFSFSRPCGICGGSGSQIDDPCGNCRGTGVERRPREVKVRIPSGIEHEQKIRLKGRGGPGSGGPDGDLYVVVVVEPHPLFGRTGRNLTLTVPITFPEAVFGAEVEVPTLQDGPVTLRLPSGTRSGRTFRVKGRGVGTRHGRGDLLVTVEVVIPQEPNEAEQAAIEALSEAGGDNPRDGLTG